MPRAKNPAQPTSRQLLIDAAVRILKGRYEALSFERLLCRPKDAAAFCRHVRGELAGVGGYTDEQILWTLLNARKQGGVARKEAAHVRGV